MSNGYGTNYSNSLNKFPLFKEELIMINKVSYTELLAICILV